MEKILAAIKEEILLAKGRQIVVAISGFGGSGKSTVANKIQESFENSAVISIDSFVTDRLSKRSTDWEGFDYVRFLHQVLYPARNQETITYNVYDWKENNATRIETAELKSVLIVEGCGLFQPDLMPFYDLSIWVDVPLEEATKRGIARDRSQGAFWDENWLTIWEPNERDFFAKYRPDKLADMAFKPQE